MSLVLGWRVNLGAIHTEVVKARKLHVNPRETEAKGGPRLSPGARQQLGQAKEEGTARDRRGAAGSARKNEQ